MRKLLRSWLTDKAVAEMGGEFSGTIATVSLQIIRNRFSGVKAEEAVLTFANDQIGWRLVLNRESRGKAA